MRLRTLGSRLAVRAPGWWRRAICRQAAGVRRAIFRKWKSASDTTLDATIVIELLESRRRRLWQLGLGALRTFANGDERLPCARVGKVTEVRINASLTQKRASPRSRVAQHVTQLPLWPPSNL